MTDDQLRSLVRETVTRVLGQALPPPQVVAPPDARLQSSHARFSLMRGGDGDGPCLIEPAVRCNHCGYCISYGH